MNQTTKQTPPLQPPPDGSHDDLKDLAPDTLREIIGDLADDRSGRDDRDDRLRAALRAFAVAEFGTIDAFAVEVGQRAGVTFSHVRNCLFYKPSDTVLDAAVEVFRERTAGPTSVPSAQAD